MSNKVITAKELLDRNVTILPMLLEGIYPQTGLVALAGGSDTGKSSLLRQLAYSICSGDSEFLGFKLNVRHRSCIYVTTEDDENAMAFLLRKQIFEEEDSDASSGLYMITEVEPNTLIQRLESQLQKNPCDVVFIDVVSDLISGDMNSQTAVRQVLLMYSLLAKRYDCLFVFLHHLKKSSIGQPTKNHLNGSQGFEAKMRAVLILSKDEDYSSLQRSLQVVKGNYTASSVKSQVYKLLFSEETLTFNLIGSQKISSVLEKELERSKTRKRIIELHGENHSYRKIEEILEEEGSPMKRSRIGEIIKELKGCPSD